MQKTACADQRARDDQYEPTPQNCIAEKEKSLRSHRLRPPRLLAAALTDCEAGADWRTSSIEDPELW